MALAVVLGVTTPSSSDGSSFVSGSFTPAANDLLVVFVQASGVPTSDAGTALASSAGLTFDRVESVGFASGADSLLCFVAKALTTNIAQTVTFTCAATATGATISVLRVSGAPIGRRGALAVRQTATQADKSSPTTPTTTYPNAALTGNADISCFVATVNPPGVTAPTSFTVRSNNGYTSPTRGLENASRDSGLTSATITWGSVSPYVWSIISIELSATALYSGAGSIVAPIAQLAATGSSVTKLSGSIVAPAARLAGSGAVANPAYPPEPQVNVLIDADGSGDFDPLVDDVTPQVKRVDWTRGRSADFGSDATGSATIVLTDPHNRYGDGSLALGRPVLIKSTYAERERAHFYGFIERITPNARDWSTTLTLYDPLRRLQETDIYLPANAYISRSVRDLRVDILADAERGSRNLCYNPEFATDLAGWDATTYAGGSLERITGQAPPVSSSATCARFTTTTTTARLIHAVRLAPLYFAGSVYRVSAYLRADAPIEVELNIFSDIVASINTRVVALTAEWQRVTLTYTMPEDVTGSGAAKQFRIGLRTPTSPGAVYLGAVSVTRGQALYPYEPVGTGRWPNWCASGSFDGGGLNGWYDLFHNLVPNPGFEVNTTGWTGLTRDTTTADTGLASGRATTTTAQISIPGTFRAGRRYAIGFAGLRDGSGGTMTMVIRSSGTPADSSSGLSVGTVGSWTDSLPSAAGASWVPSANRSDVIVQISGLISTHNWLDSVYVFAMGLEQSSSDVPAYAASGPCGGTGVGISTKALSSIARFGARSMSSTTEATAGAGRLYDFHLTSPWFIAGRRYSLQLWLYPVGGPIPYRASLGRSASDGSWDESLASGTAAADAWTQVTLDWTPAADAGAVAFARVVAAIMQTDAIARTFLVDGVRVIPDALDDVEPAHWLLPPTEDDDPVATSYQVSSTALAALQGLNALTLSRHYVRPSLVAPFYEYVVAGRDGYVGRTPDWTLVNDFAGFTEADLDRDAIVNVVPATWAGPTAYYSDPDSVGLYGPHPGHSVGGSAFLALATVEPIALAMLARYSIPRRRPTMVLHQRFPLQVDVDLDDLLELTLDNEVFPFGIVEQPYLVVRETVAVDKSLRDWTSTLALEAYAGAFA